MEKKKWPEKVTNEQILERIGEKRTPVKPNKTMNGDRRTED